MTAAKAVWTSCREQLPKDGELVMTKIDDSKGERNVQPLRRQGRLWFVRGGTMYVYYDPTHWKPLEAGECPGK